MWMMDGVGPADVCTALMNGVYKANRGSSTCACMRDDLLV
jgi:hypothetical protein